jgi:hypothetical protein
LLIQQIHTDLVPWSPIIVVLTLLPSFLNCKLLLVNQIVNFLLNVLVFLLFVLIFLLLLHSIYSFCTFHTLCFVLLIYPYHYYFRVSGFQIPMVPFVYLCRLAYICFSLFVSLLIYQCRARFCCHSDTFRCFLIYLFKIILHTLYL